MFTLFYWFFFSIPVQGYVPIMLAITFTSGVQMTMLGVLGEYLWRTLDEVRRRPAFVIDKIYNTIASSQSEGGKAEKSS
jgi:dolichol-phosphate mannosyltransferase